MVKRIFLLICTVFILTQSGQAQAKPGLVPKSEKTALRYSLYGTLIPVAVGGIILLNESENLGEAQLIFAGSVGAFGIIFGPAFGHCYAERYGYLLKGFLIRGLTLGTYALIAAAQSSRPCFGAICSNGGKGDYHIFPAIVLPVGIAIVSAIYDTAIVGKSVDKYNNEHGFSKIKLTPTYFAQENAPGLMLSINF